MDLAIITNLSVQQTDKVKCVVWDDLLVQPLA